MDSTLGVTPESRVTVLIGDACANRRRTIRCELTTSAVWVVGEAVDVHDLVVELETCQPRVLVVSDGLLKERIAVAQLHLQVFGSVVRTLVLTESPCAESPWLPVCDLWGCLSYSRVEQDLLRAVLLVANGEMWFSRRQLAEMLHRHAAIAMVPDSERLILQGMTSREVEIIQWVIRGKTNKEIAHALKISDLTVKTHVHNIFKKSGMHRRGELPAGMLVM
jgi:DNA-binding NarL/FixJ family response regulator